MPADQQTILYATTPEGITTITINRPHVRNAVNASTALQLASAFRKFNTDEAQKVCVITGSGDTFCAGYDLHEVANTPLDKPRTNEVDEINGTPGPMGPTRMMLSKPVIAAIAGHAVAGGLELSLLADMRVCDTTAVFGVFCRRFGVPLIDGGTVRLPKIIGFGRAMDMILTGRAVDAHEALTFGLANRVVEKGKALEEALILAKSLLAFPQLCMRSDRSSTYYGAFNSANMLDALKFEYTGGSRVIGIESVSGAAKFDRGEGRSGSFESKERL